jgi:anoctamin-10
VTEELAGRGPATAREMLIGAAGAALIASHGYLLLRLVIRHLAERLVWSGNAEVQRADAADRGVKEAYVRSLGVVVPGVIEGGAANGHANGQVQVPQPTARFWNTDEGVTEIRRAVKDE